MAANSITDLNGFHVETKMLSPADVWRDKDEYVERERKSYIAWEGLSMQEREAIKQIVRRALDRLHDDVDVWVPAALQVKSGSCIDVQFRLMFSDIEDEIQQSELITSRTIAEAAEDTAKLIEELS